MASNIKKVLGITKKKSEDAEEDACSYSDPTLFHSTEPPSRNSRGFSQPRYPPPRPQHSPNPRRRNQEGTTQGKKDQQTDASARNSAVEPRRAPPRPNVAKKDSQDDDYCDPIDVQRKDNFYPELANKAIKDDYCEPWDTTKKTDFGSNVGRKTSQTDEEHNEYMDPYDTGKDGIIEKRRSRGIGKDFHNKVQHPNELQKKVISENNQAPSDPRVAAASSSDYDMPWEWKKQIQIGMAPVTKPKPVAPQNQRPTKTAGPKDDYDEPWENKQAYLLKNQITGGAAKARSPVPLPRVDTSTQSKDELYEQPWEALDPQAKMQARQDAKGNLYETPWEEANGNKEASPLRRASQPALPTAPQPAQQRKTSHSAVGGLTDYDTPWEYKNARKFPSISSEPAEPPSEVNPDLPLDDQSWYHGPIKRLDAEDLLRDAPDCSFLVRNSESSKRDFSLSMKNNDNYLHLKIVRQIDGQFILGQFSKPFMDIPKVIHHYSKNKLNIRGAEHKYLKHPIAAQPEYHTIEPDQDCHL